MKRAIILQGNIHQHTSECYRSFKKWYPNVPIIVSCYDTCTGLEFVDSEDFIVRSKDPGPCVKPNGKHAACISLNRHIISSLRGLIQNLSDDAVVIKCRNDLIATKGDLFGIWEKMNQEFETDSFRFFTDKVLIPSVYTIDPLGSLGFAFHPSDWLMVGRAYDLKSYYNCQLKDVNKDVENDKGQLYHRNEQYLFTTFLGTDMSHDEDPVYHRRIRPLITLMDHFIVANLSTLGVESLKYPNIYEDPTYLLTEEKYRAYHQKF